MQAHSAHQTENAHHHTDQYFTFMLGTEEYGFNILSVLEIRGLERLTPIPSAPNFIKGVLNLRGLIIPVMDLRTRFGMPEIDYGRSTVVVVLQLKHLEEIKEIGIIVDCVSDVYSIDPQNIKPKPDICNNKEQDYILGITNIEQENNEDKLVILLDANKIIHRDELQPVTQQLGQDSYEKN